MAGARDFAELNDADSVLLQMGRELTCNECNEILKNPHSLSCQHHFCKDCLEDYFVDSTTQCPTCKKPCWRKEARENHSLRAIIDAYLRLADKMTRHPTSAAGSKQAKAPSPASASSSNSNSSSMPAPIAKQPRRANSGSSAGGASTLSTFNASNSSNSSRAAAPAAVAEQAAPVAMEDDTRTELDAPLSPPPPARSALAALSPSSAGAGSEIKVLESQDGFGLTSPPHRVGRGRTSMSPLPPRHRGSPNALLLSQASAATVRVDESEQQDGDGDAAMPAAPVAPASKLAGGNSSSVVLVRQSQSPPQRADVAASRRATLSPLAAVIPSSIASSLSDDSAQQSPAPAPRGRRALRNVTAAANAAPQQPAPVPADKPRKPDVSPSKQQLAAETQQVPSTVPMELDDGDHDNADMQQEHETIPPTLAPTHSFESAAADLHLSQLSERQDSLARHQQPSRLGSMDQPTIPAASSCVLSSLQRLSSSEAATQVLSDEADAEIKDASHAAGAGAIAGASQASVPKPSPPSAAAANEEDAEPDLSPAQPSLSLHLDPFTQQQPLLRHASSLSMSADGKQEKQASASSTSSTPPLAQPNPPTPPPSSSPPASATTAAGAAALQKQSAEQSPTPTQHLLPLPNFPGVQQTSPLGGKSRSSPAIVRSPARGAATAASGAAGADQSLRPHVQTALFPAAAPAAQAGSSSSSSSSSAAAGPGAESKRATVGLLIASLNPEQMKLVDQFCAQFGATVINGRDYHNMTHFVCETDLAKPHKDGDGKDCPYGQHRVTRRTFKYLVALLHGAWIVRLDWIAECLKAQRLLPEAPFEACGDNIADTAHSPARARLRTTTNAAKLFDGIVFSLHGPYSPREPSEANMTDLIQFGGGTLTKLVIDPNKPASGAPAPQSFANARQLLLCRPDYGTNPQPNEASVATMREQTGFYPISLVWVLDSISVQKLREFDHFYWLEQPDDDDEEEDGEGDGEGDEDDAESVAAETQAAQQAPPPPAADEMDETQ